MHGSAAATVRWTSCSSTTSSSSPARTAPRRSSSTPSTRSTTANKQIVLTSDRKPRSLPTLAERLRSRFEWGPGRRHRAARARGAHGDPAQEGRSETIPMPDDVSASSPSRSSRTSASSRAPSSASPPTPPSPEAHDHLDRPGDPRRSARPREHLTVTRGRKAVAATTASSWPTSRASAATSRSLVRPAGRDVPGPPAHQGQLPRPRPRVRRSRPHHGHLAFDKIQAPVRTRRAQVYDQMTDLMSVASVSDLRMRPCGPMWDTCDLCCGAVGQARPFIHHGCPKLGSTGPRAPTFSRCDSSTVSTAPIPTISVLK